jgi:DNA helicase-2/ATP-dependent DNA helicase PcrA
MGFELSGSQQAAVQSRERKLCILACAGSGKTTTLTRRVAGLVETGELEPAQGAVITFTVLAADHLRIELANLLTQANATSALFIGTIHAFCLELLRASDPLRGDRIRVLADNQQYLVLNRYWDKWNIQAIAPDADKARLLDALVTSIDIIKLERIPEPALKQRHPELARVCGLYREYLRGKLYYDFTDLLLETVTRLEGDPAFRDFVLGKYSHLFVDEYQDVDPLQERLIQLIASKAELSVVGDDDQAIYQFRGTDVKNIRTLANRLPRRAVITLDDNRRCANNITELSKRIVERCNGRLPKPIHAVREGGAVLVRRFPNVDDEASFIADTIKTLRTGPRRFGDFAVLMRSVASYGHFYLDALRAASIPFVCKGDRSLFTRPEVRAITGALEVICKEPLLVEHLSDLADLVGYDLSHLIGDKRDPAALTDADYATVGFDASDVTAVRAVLEVRDRYLAGRFDSILDIVLAVIESLKLLWNPRPAAEFFNVCGLTQIAVEFDEIEQTRRLHRFCGYVQAYARRQFDEAIPLDPDVDAVQVLTVHQAKGLEYDVVFVPMLVKDRFPLESSGKRWLLDDDLFDWMRYANDLDDERRLFYVAATRARDRLFLTCSKDVGLKNPKQASVFHREAAAFVPPDPPTEPTRSASRRGSLPLVTSHSSLEYYLSCPYRYLLLKEFGLASPENPFFAVGRALHLVMGVIHQHGREGRLMPAAEAEELLKEQLAGADGIPPYVLARRLQAVTKAVKNYLADHRSWILSTADVECSFDIPAFGSVIRGRIDLIIRNEDGSASLIDWKTGHQREYLHPEFQMQLYAWAARDQLGLEISKALLYYVEERRSHESEVSHSFIDSGKDAARHLLAGITEKQFQPTPGAVCTRCECRRVCEHRN